MKLLFLCVFVCCHAVLNSSPSGGNSKLCLTFDRAYCHHLWNTWLEVYAWGLSCSSGWTAVLCSTYFWVANVSLSPESDSALFPYQICLSGTAMGFRTPTSRRLPVALQSMKRCASAPGIWAVCELCLLKAPLFRASSPYGWASQVQLEARKEDAVCHKKKGERH